LAGDYVDYGEDRPAENVNLTIQTKKCFEEDAYLQKELIDM